MHDPTALCTHCGRKVPYRGGYFFGHCRLIDPEPINARKSWDKIETCPGSHRPVNIDSGDYRA